MILKKNPSNNFVWLISFAISAQTTVIQNQVFESGDMPQ